MLHRIVIGEPDTEAGWYRRLKESVDEDLTRLDTGSKRRWYPLGERRLAFGDLLTIAATASVTTLLALGYGSSEKTYGGLTPSQARHEAERSIAAIYPGGTTLSYTHEAEGSDTAGRDAWLVYFNPLSGRGSGYSGCVVTTNTTGATPSPECSGY